MEEKLDKILQKKVNEVSMNVANTIASQIMKMVQGTMQRIPAMQTNGALLEKTPPQITPSKTKSEYRKMFTNTFS